jgi:thiol-disulfide isomerase/thioredoxin
MYIRLSSLTQIFNNAPRTNLNPFLNYTSMPKLFIIIALFLLGNFACTERKQEQQTPAVEVVNEMNKIRLTSLNGQPISLKEYKGKIIFINFWATWCKPCIEEMPSIQEAQEILQNKDIIFLMASGESPEQIQQFKTGNPYQFNYVRIENIEEMNVQALPTTFIFNRKGNLVFSEMGYRNWAEKNNIDLINKIANENE